MLKFYPIAFLIVFLGLRCSQNKPGVDDSSLAMAKDSITQLTANTAQNITEKGPIGWLDIFENSPEFYMVSLGKLEFNNYAVAEKIVKEQLANQISKITLQFTDIRVTPLSADAGTVGAAFHEEMTDRTNMTVNFNGYFTATAHHTAAGWKFLNIHWSIRDPKN